MLFNVLTYVPLLSICGSWVQHCCYVIEGDHLLCNLKFIWYKSWYQTFLPKISAKFLIRCNFLRKAEPTLLFKTQEWPTSIFSSQCYCIIKRKRFMGITWDNDHLREMLWYFIKFSQLILQGNIWKSVLRICINADFGSYRVKQKFFFTNKIELLPNDSCKSSQSFVAITSNLNSYDIKLIKVKITCINNQDLNNQQNR